MKTLITITLTALVAVSATWFALRGSHGASSAPPASGYKALYQCSMHPWITSDKPGRCTICGMELTLVAASNKGHGQPMGDHIVSLSESQIQVVHVATSEAKTRPLIRTLPVAGMITENAMRHRVLAAYVDGRVDKLYVNYLGAEVTAGQPLAEFYSPTLLQAEREYRQLGGELRKNAALRLRQMGLAPEQIGALDQKPADVLTSQILSPVSGTVVTQSVYQGQYVATGAQLFEIADFSTMWFIFRAYEQDMPWIQTGQLVTITTAALPDKTYSGKITFIDPNFDDTTRSAKVRVELPNPLVNGKRELLSRFYAEGIVELDAPEVLTIPRSAVIETGPQAVVYIDRGGGAYEPVALQLGRRGDDLVEVLSELKERDKVVTHGNLLIDGQAELNRAFTEAPESAAATAVATGTLTNPQQLSITAFLKTADAMSAALGADDPAAFNTASKPAADATESMLQQLRPLVADTKALDALDQARHIHESANLADARAAFHKFTVAATAVLQPLRKTPGMPDFQVYECPMVSQAIPGVPNRARWIQTGNREMRNPFFGKDMPDCGATIER